MEFEFTRKCADLRFSDQSALNPSDVEVYSKLLCWFILLNDQNPHSLSTVNALFMKNLVIFWRLSVLNKPH